MVTFQLLEGVNLHTCATGATTFVCRSPHHSADRLLISASGLPKRAAVTALSSAIQNAFAGHPLSCRTAHLQSAQQ